ncbi:MULTISPECIES: LLM class flavin-dependent oxidoreductase [Paenibacillus]|uniref:LLM class flavin-dependent oxidoreductase n=1 Tax=Paenibacillus TaxID=44249 RepID=UPI0022B8AA8B|nr:LLM class flavin-dependent oxidoreductase [Paenibacillus caseinilyticus]MCZ8521719.1 LLM class flavin-dependent oxidoreductase [Paenibacillus caseinilyticus]
MGLLLSLLDQSPIAEGETPEEAFRHTLKLARRAEELGFHRFWVSEHHDSKELAGSSPEVLISYLLAKTEKIRIGSGGVMLQHYSPYKVAENFGVLASLAPGRVDLGIGRAPGGLPQSTKALQYGTGGGQVPLDDKLEALQKYVLGVTEPGHELYGVRAAPVAAQPAELFLLGAGTDSAALAGRLGIPYVYAEFISGDPEGAAATFAAYRQHLGQRPEVKPLLASSVLIADTDEEASQLAADAKVIKVHLASGRKVTVKTVESAEDFGRQSGEKFTIDVKQAQIIHGSPDTVRGKLIQAAERHGLEEIILTPYNRTFEARFRTVELLQEAFARPLTAAAEQLTP